MAFIAYNEYKWLTGDYYIICIVLTSNKLNSPLMTIEFNVGGMMASGYGGATCMYTVLYSSPE